MEHEHNMKTLLFETHVEKVDQNLQNKLLIASVKDCFSCWVYL